MARFLFWSDLHLEHAPFEVPSADPGLRIDGILLAGDIGTKGLHVEFMNNVWQTWQVPVRAVIGNHEAYGSKRFQKHQLLERERLETLRSFGADIDVLRGAECVIGDTRVIGATLWTDLNLYPDDAGQVYYSVKERMNDYRLVRWFDDRRIIYRKMIPEDTQGMHATERDYIMSRLDEPFAGRTVVMTHHLPIPDMLPPGVYEERRQMTAAYASDLTSLIMPRRLDAWICGHVHIGREVTLEGAHGPVRFLSNMRGYPNETTRFDPLRVLDTNALG